MASDDQSVQLEEQIRSALVGSFSPTHLEIEDISGGCGSSFNLLIVSDAFEGIDTCIQEAKRFK